MKQKFYYYHYYITKGSSLDDYIGCGLELVLTGLLALIILVLAGLAFYFIFHL